MWIWEYKKWPQFSWDAAQLIQPLALAHSAQGKVLGAARMLDSSLSSEAVAAILVEDGLTTSAIEGERLNVDVVRSSVAHHLGLPRAAAIKVPRAVDGLMTVLLDATQHYAMPLTLKRLCSWQSALFPTGRSGLHEIKTGALRGKSPMRVVSDKAGREHVHFIAPRRDVLEAMLNEFIEWFNAPPASLDSLVRAGIAHLWFVTLHPFEDGNGRLARAITDMALAQAEQQSMRVFSLSAQILRERKHYYDVLEKTQRGNLDITEWLIWFLTQIANAATASQLSIANTLMKARFWLKHQTTALNERQRKVLNRLLDAEPQGFVGDMTTRKYQSLTRASRATAYRELNDLVEKGCLEPNDQAGRSAGYRLVIEHHA